MGNFIKTQAYRPLCVFNLLVQCFCQLHRRVKILLESLLRNRLLFQKKDLTGFLAWWDTVMTVEKWIEKLEAVQGFLCLLWKHWNNRVNKYNWNIVLDCSPFSGIRKKSNRFIYSKTPKASQLECFFPPDYFFSCLWHVLTFLSVLSLQRHNVVSISATSTSKIKYIAEEYLFFPKFSITDFFPFKNSMTYCQCNFFIHYSL